MVGLFFSILLASSNRSLDAQTLRTIAGGGPRGIFALETGLAQPSGIAVDAIGNVYISLAQLNQIWKVDTLGKTSLFAGNGSYPFDADNVPAESATLNHPQGLAFDAAGNLYVADSGHNRVRRISTSGTMTTVAGNGLPGFGGDGGISTGAQLNNPVAVAVDASNNLYIADLSNHRIRMVTSAGIISTLAGSGSADFAGDNGPASLAALNQPSGVAVDSSSAVYIADSGNFRVRKVASGTITTIAGNGTSGFSGDNGPAIAAQLNELSGLAVDQQNNLLILESSDIRKIRWGSTNITTLAGAISPGFSGDNGPPTSATFRNPKAIAIDRSGTVLYIADSGNSRIRRVTSSLVTTLAGNGTLDYNGNNGPATNASLLTPTSLALDNAGGLAFSDAGSSSLRRLALSSGILSTVGGSGVSGNTADGGPSTGPLSNPFALAYDKNGIVYFVESHRIRKLSAGVCFTVANVSNAAGFAGDGGPAADAQLSFPSGLAVTPDGDLYVADSQNNRIRLINGRTRMITTIAGIGAAGSTGDNGLATAATLNYPVSVSLDGAGNLFVSELLGNRVRKIVLTTNIITTVAGDGTVLYADGTLATATGLSAPLSIFADQASNVFIADQGHSRVRKVNASTGIISTVAGNGSYDFSGDGGLALAASINPLGVTMDSSQNLYISDSSGRVLTTPVVACFFVVNPPVVYLDSSGGSRSLTVTATDASCPYTVGGNSSFVTITSGASGNGSGVVTLSFAGNPGLSRATAITVGGASFSVVQTGILSPQGAPQGTVPMGATATFAILAGSTVVASGGGTITGNIGISPGTAFVAGVPSATVNGNIYAGGPISAQAQADSTVAFNNAAGRQGPASLSGDIGGQTLTPGLYRSLSSLAISSGDLILDAQGNPNAVFIFQVPSTFDMNSGREVILSGGATAANIFWQVGGSATLGTFSFLHGSILAAGSVSLLTGARLEGRALSLASSVSIDTSGTNSISIPVAPALQFVPIAPCRLVDTRNPAGAFGGPVMVSQTTRNFSIPSGSCNIPASAQAYSFNVAVVPQGLFAYLTMWPAGQLQPLVSTLNSEARVRSNAAILPAGDNGAVSVFVTHNAHVVLDINGYFVPANTAGAMAYYPLPPCRVIDTRNPIGPLGGPFLAGQSSRTIPIRSSSCNLPPTAQAYSLNLTAVPHGPLGYLTAWATGSAQPLASSLNAPTGTVTSSAAILPAGLNGSIDVFASNETDLVVDINGYFGPPGPGGLSLYNLTPCRVLDSRLPLGARPFLGTLNVAVTASSCGAPPSAQAYVFNSTVIPSAALGYLTLWAQTAAQPNVSTLNASDGAITANLAIVPTSTGSISAFTSNPSHLVLDLFGYFAP